MLLTPTDQSETAPTRWPLATRPMDVCMIVVWLVQLGAVLVLPCLMLPDDPSDALIRWTVRLSLLYYAAAAVLMLRCGSADWRAENGRGRLARWCWTLAWAAFVIHVGVSFHFYHHWSHQSAFQHVEAVSHFGYGIYISYLFTILWTADVVWWWLEPNRYALRLHRIGWLMHAFMAFIIFCGTVVYEPGLIRWAGLLMFVGLGLLLLVSGRRKVSG